MVAMRRVGSSLRAIADFMKAQGFDLSHVGAKHVGAKKVIEAAEKRKKQQAA